MKKLIFFLLLTGLCTSAFARIELIIPRDDLHQGEIVEGALRFSGEDVTKVGRLNLSGLLVEDTLFIANAGSALMNDGVDYLDVSVTFSFVKVPDSPILTQKSGEELIQIDTSGIRVIPSEAGNEFLLEDFEIAVRKEWGIFILMGLLGLILLAGAIKLLFYLQGKRRKKAEYRHAREQLLHAQSYDEITQVWMDRHRLLKLFPEGEAAFRQFETIYFKFAFKPSRSEVEITEIQKAFQELSKGLMGGQDGV